MRKIIKIREGDVIPEGATYLKTVQEADSENRTREWRPKQNDILGSIIPIFARETLYEITPIATFHYYEIVDGPKEGE